MANEFLAFDTPWLIGEGVQGSSWDRFRLVSCGISCHTMYPTMRLYSKLFSLWLLYLLWDSIRSFSYDALDLNLWPVSRNNTWVFVWRISIYYAFINNNILLCNKSVHDYLSCFLSFKNIKYLHNFVQNIYRIYIIMYARFFYDLLSFCGIIVKYFFIIKFCFLY